MVETRGWKSTLAYIKDLKVVSLRALSGSPLTPDQLGTKMSIDKNGFPRIIPLEFRSELVKGNLRSQQDLFTILKVGDLSTWFKDPDLSPLWLESTCDQTRGSYQNLVMKSKGAIKALGIAIPGDRITFDSFHMTSKKGPNGPALMTAISETRIEGFNP